jgi:membrane protease YdiL (CAAX protease family)
MSNELKFCLYIIVCIAIGFVDFFFNLRGLFTLLFDIVLAILLISKKREQFFFGNYLNINNVYVILILVLLSIMINLFFVKKSSYSEYNFDFYFVTSIFLKSFTEEVVFRGYWLRSFLTNRGKWFSVIFISLGFTVLHYFSGADLVFAFLGSITLSFLYIKTKSILNTYMVHLLSNLFFIFGLPEIIALYSNTEAKIKVKTIIIIILVIIYLFKLLLKKSDNNKD